MILIFSIRARFFAFPTEMESQFDFMFIKQKCQRTNICIEKELNRKHQTSNIQQTKRTKDKTISRIRIFLRMVPFGTMSIYEHTLNYDWNAFN